jgi:hypothetical protein
MLIRDFGVDLWEVLEVDSIIMEDLLELQRINPELFLIAQIGR